MNEKIKLYLKGLLMGTCDLIPGISGGTIAFITGIYDKLIKSISNISLKLFSDGIKYLTNKTPETEKEIRKDLKEADVYFLLTLGLGIATAILIGSKGIKYLWINYYTFTIAFFAGLIIASSKIIFDDIKKHSKQNIFFGLIGFVFGASLAFLIPVNAAPSHLYVFIGGFFAVSAMFLPGISGSFILLIMGLWDFMINVFTDIPGKIDYFIASASGALIGMFFISRVINFLFTKDRCKTLYFLLGLVLGSLLVPFKRIYENTVEWNLQTILLLLGLFFLGIMAVLIMHKLQKKKTPKTLKS